MSSSAENPIRWQDRVRQVTLDPNGRVHIVYSYKQFIIAVLPPDLISEDPSDHMTKLNFHYQEIVGGEGRTGSFYAGVPDTGDIQIQAIELTQGDPDREGTNTINVRGKKTIATPTIEQVAQARVHDYFLDDFLKKTELALADGKVWLDDLHYPAYKRWAERPRQDLTATQLLFMQMSI